MEHDILHESNAILFDKILHYDEKIRKYLGFSWITPEARLLALVQVRQPTIKDAMHESFLSDRAFYLMIKRLREDGLIHVICDPDDGRVRRVVVGNSEVSKLMDLDFLRHQDHQGAARQGSPPLTLPLADVFLGWLGQTTEGLPGMKDGRQVRYTLEFKQEAIRLVRSVEKMSSVTCTLAYRRSHETIGWRLKRRGDFNVSIFSDVGLEIVLFTHDALERQAKNAVTWAAVALVFAGAAWAYAVTQNAHSTTTGSICGPCGTSNFGSQTYNPTAATLGVGGASGATAAGLIAINRSLDDTVANLNARILQTTTIDPSIIYGGQIVSYRVNLGVNAENGVPYNFKFNKI